MKAPDAIDRILDQWARERPDLDTRGFGVVARLLVLGRQLERRVESALEPVGLSLWAFDVLATLRRQGTPYCLTPTELSRATLLTPGAMTNRIDHLEEAGFVRREAEPNDRRGIRVLLTERGRELIDRAMELRFEEARSAASLLPKGEYTKFEAQLRHLLAALEHETAQELTAQSRAETGSRLAPKSPKAARARSREK